MKIHRFYAPTTQLTHKLWVQDTALLHQWNNVLRFRPGQQVILFDGNQHDKLYKIIEINKREAQLDLITDYQQKVPVKNLYLFWSLLKKDKNDWVLQKATELGASHFVPLLADRCDKTGFNIERAQKIIIEASEQCGRSNIPSVREPIRPQAAIEQFQDKIALLICEQGSDAQYPAVTEVGLLIGPEGGWSESERQLFHDKSIKFIGISDFTLRAETAAIASIAKLC